MTIAIIDGDVVAYMCCKSRYVDSAGRTMVTDPNLLPQFTPEQDAKYMEESWINFQEIVNDLCELCFTDQFKMAVKGIGNFRLDMYPAYKANRHADPRKRNPFVEPLRQRAVERGMATFAHNMEADDLMRMWQHEAIQNGEKYVICSIDKDLKCMAGRHYLMHKNEFLDVTPEYAIRFYYEQLLKGDPTDNIKGIPKVGDVKARNFLAEANTEEEFQIIVQKCYQAAFGKDDWKKELILTGNLIYLKKHADDWFTLDGWPDVPYVELEVPDEAVKPVKKIKAKKSGPETTTGTPDTAKLVERVVFKEPITIVGVPPPVGDSWGKKKGTTNAT